MATLSDKGLSDMKIQTWLDDSLNSQILGYFVYGQASKQHSRAHPNNETGFYTGLFGISIWQLLGMNNNSPSRRVLNLFPSSCQEDLQGTIIHGMYNHSPVHLFYDLCRRFVD